MIKIKRIIKTREFIILCTILLLTFFISLYSKSFLRLENIKNIFMQVSSVAISAIGMTFIIITGGIDVSAGSIFGLSALTMAKLATSGINPIVSLILGALVGTLLGLLNGILISKIHISPIIVTLGTMSLWRTMIFFISGGRWILGIPSEALFFGTGTIGDFPFPIFLMIIFVIFFSYFSVKRPFARYIYAYGNNPEFLRISGINTSNVLLFTYTLAGFMYAISAFIVVGRTGIVQANIGTGYELQVIAAVVLGGTSITGGKGTIIGSFLGATMIAVISNGLIMLNVPALLENLILGILILVSVIADILSNRGETK
ncbi:hypothetical protein PW5551_08620 [Petrotoga sp. 9PW.55.5.1]|uniref:ABC transporter permease n=1 Tax=Petrotoga sp. 9PW.55.5.1 TaxID=1308979 RepID=UPI000DC26877|nr:ABC transporter permease [Petrotoga sp. 9PW.55.5.1]RAO98660.1 hypothetical protein PW5551_08620 [Petrotoga sp. 9PW.55.5.1]